MQDLRALNDDAVVLQDVMITDIELDGIALSSALDLILRQTDPPLTWVVKDEVVLITTVSAAESDEYMFLRSYEISRLRQISQLTGQTRAAGNGQQGGGFGGGGFGFGGGGAFSLPFEPSQFGGGGTPTEPQNKTTQPSKQEPEESNAVPSKKEFVISWEGALMSTIMDMTAPPCHWFDLDGEGGRMSIAGNRLIVRQSRKGHEQVVAVLEQLEMAAEDAAEEE